MHAGEARKLIELAVHPLDGRSALRTREQVREHERALGTRLDAGSHRRPRGAEREPGDRIQVTYSDAGGATATVTVTLGEGPAA